VKDRWLRRLVPSVPVVARWPGVAPALDGADAVLRRVDRRYADLPPASLRLRIGVDNRLLRNATVWDDAVRFVARLVDRGWIHDGATVLELGAGVGRNAVALRRNVRYDRYTGIDADPEMVAWCQAHLADATTDFHHADIASSVYNPGGRPIEHYRLPLADASVSFSLGVSVFSHVLGDVAERFAAELGRVTTAGGIAAHTFFLVDHLDPLLGDRWSFEHELGRCRVQSLRYPEAAVAYRRSDVVELFDAHGLRTIDVLDEGAPQQLVVFEKR
jgi:SAM-dependent methyltransferase